MNNLTYCIVDFPASDEQYASAIESADTVRKSLDETKCVLKWRGATPAPFDGLPTMDHAAALALMSTPEWRTEILLRSWDEYTVNELKNFAKLRGIIGYSSMRKSELLEALS